MESAPPFLSTTRLLGAFFLVSSMVVLAPSPALGSTTYPVPEDGLSFDANDTTEINPCTAGYGNADGDAETDEVNFLEATDSLRYKNIATISGQAIDAEVTLTSVTGMETKGGAATLDRLDKCDIDADSGLMEISFRSVTTSPGDANFVLTIEFLESGGSTAATLTNLKMNVEDIDSNQYLEVDDFTSTRLAPGRDSTDVQEYSNGDTIDVGGGNTVNLTTTATAKRYHSTGSSSSSDSAVEQDKHVVEVTYASVSTLVLTLGAYESGSGSFDLNFRGFEFQSDSEQPESSAAENAGVRGPAIALTPLFRVGQEACARQVLTSGFGLKQGSTQTLELWQPRTQLSQTVLTGTGFEETTSMPLSLSPGTYQLALTATGQGDEALGLIRTFSVDSSCVVTSIDEGRGGFVANAELARTGSPYVTALIALSSILAAAGLGAVVISRRLAKSTLN